MSQDIKIPNAREIPFEDWDHFLSLVAIKTYYDKVHKKKITLADASVIFVATEYAEKEKAMGLIMIKDDKESV